MITINSNLSLSDDEVELSAIRAQGSGGQNVNKVSSAIHLRFDIRASSLPEHIRQRLLDSGDSRITNEGVFVLKAQNYRTQEQNRADALARLAEWIAAKTRVDKPRKATRVPKAAKRRRLDAKKKSSERKQLRQKIDY